jgi:hypothetical protein
MAWQLLIPMLTKKSCSGEILLNSGPGNIGSDCPGHLVLAIS